MDVLDSDRRFARGDRRFHSGASFRLLLTRDFGCLWLGEAISQVGDGLNRVALLWFAYQTSQSALKMSFIGVVQTLPPLLFGPLIGVYLDRLPKKPAMVVISLVRGGLVALVPVLYALQLLNLESLGAIVLVMSVISAFAGPALLTAVPLVVAPTELAPANALIQATATIGVLLGPSVAAIGISLFGISNVLFIDAASFGLFASCVALARLPDSHQRVVLPQGTREIAADLREGFRYLLQRQRGILALTLVAGFQNMGASAFVFMLPAFVKQDFVAGPVWLGLLWSAFGLGTLLASISIALIGAGNGARLVRIACVALLLGGASVAALSFVRVKLAASALMVVIGWSAAAFNPVVLTLVQASTPENLRARVLTAYNSASMAAVTVGMLGFGYTADRVGQAPTMVVIGGVLLVTAFPLVLAARVSVVRRLWRRSQPSVIP